MRHAQIKAGRAVNFLKVADPAAFPEMTLVASAVAGEIGDVWDGQAFTTPPEVLAARQAAAAEAALEADVRGETLLGTVRGFATKQLYNDWFRTQVTDANNPQRELEQLVRRMLWIQARRTPS